MTDEGRPYEQFLRRVASVTELGMRVALWREYFSQNHPDIVLGCVRALLAESEKRNPDAHVAMLALSRLLTTHRPLVEKVLIPAAVVARCNAVLDLVTTASPARAIHTAEIRPPFLNQDREVTLGERRAWARRTDRNLLDRLVLDPDPGVVRNLLQNPRILERDVLRMASAQPVSAEVLHEIFKSDRWYIRRTVQLALLQNPYTPPRIAMALIELLDESGLRDVHRTQSIQESVRRAAGARLRSFPLPMPIPSEIVEEPWVLELLERRRDNDE